MEKETANTTLSPAAAAAVATWEQAVRAKKEVKLPNGPLSQAATDYAQAVVNADYNDGASLKTVEEKAKALRGQLSSMSPAEALSNVTGLAQAVKKAQSRT